MKFSYLFFAVITLSLQITPSSGRIGNTEANNAATFLDEEQKILENTQNDEEVHRLTKHVSMYRFIMYVVRGGKNVKETVGEAGGSAGGAQAYYNCLVETFCSLENACELDKPCGVDSVCTKACFGTGPQVSPRKVCLPVGSDIDRCPTSMRLCKTNEDCNINGESCYDPCGVEGINKESCNCAV